MVDFQQLLFKSRLEKKYSFHKIYGGISDSNIIKIVEFLRLVCKNTPLFTPTMKNGTKYNLQMTSIGKYGWISDEKGYYYLDKHPNQKSWVEIPDWLYNIVQFQFDYKNLKYDAKEYDSCLINYYTKNSKLGMHVDNTEKDLTFPIVSFSIGAPAKFDIEFGTEKVTYLLDNSDVVIMDGLSRNCKHGIKEIIEEKKASPLKEKNSRINLTFRKTGL